MTGLGRLDWLEYFGVLRCTRSTMAQQLVSYWRGRGQATSLMLISWCWRLRSTNQYSPATWATYENSPQRSRLVGLTYFTGLRPSALHSGASEPRRGGTARKEPFNQVGLLIEQAAD